MNSSPVHFYPVHVKAHKNRKRNSEMRETHKLIPSIRLIPTYRKFKIARIARSQRKAGLQTLWVKGTIYDFDAWTSTLRPAITHTFNHKVIQNSVAFGIFLSIANHHHFKTLVFVVRFHHFQLNSFPIEDIYLRFFHILIIKLTVWDFDICDLAS